MSDEPVDKANRVAVVIGALLIIFGALLVVLLAWGASADAASRLEDLAGWIRDHDTQETKIGITLIATVIVLIMLTIIIVELTPSPTQKMRVRDVKSGDAAITTKEIAQRIESEVRGVEHVATCDAIVAARGKRIEVVLDLEVDAAADLSATADAACRRAHELVEQQLGIELVEKPRARLRYRELRLREGPKRPETGWERPEGRPPAEHEEERDYGQLDAT